jgi:zeaxanthin glucosyltransferase
MPLEQKKWHFGVFSFTGSGHLNPFMALSRQLKERGHRITFFEKPKIQERVLSAGLGFHPIDDSNSPFKGKKPDANNAGLSSQLSTLRFNLKRIAHDLELYLRELPRALSNSDVDVLLVNEIALTGPTVAEMLRLPYFVISTSVPHNFGWDAYPWRAGCKLSRSWLSRLENELFEISAVRMHGPICRILNKYRDQEKLRPVRGINALYPPLAQITQLPRCLDLPRNHFPEGFHYTGPWVRQEARPRVDFPWERLDGRPMIYASLGTTRNAQPEIFHLIAEACKEMDVQLVISLGGRFDPARFSGLPGNPVVARYVPQLEILKLAKLVITHGGPNTVFEALMEGKPMIAIPLAHDQPAIAMRLERLGIALVLPIMRLSTDQIRAAVTRVLSNGSYRDAAERVQRELHSFQGVEIAVEIIERNLDAHESKQACDAAEYRSAEECFKQEVAYRSSIAPR